MASYKALFHINESEKWNTVMANANNLVRDLGNGGVTVVVIANGEAVRDYAYGNEEFLSAMGETASQGVEFLACRNALVGNRIDAALLPRWVKVVPAAVTELVTRQADGYAYIKP